VVDAKVFVEDGAAIAVRVAASQHPEIMDRVARRAAMSARNAVIAQIRRVFAQGRRRSGGRFEKAVPKIRRNPVDFGDGAFGYEVLHKADYRLRRRQAFDLFWLFSGTPRTVTSARGKFLTIPIGAPSTPESVVPSRRWGRAASIAWPEDLEKRGWKFWVLSPARSGKRHPILMGVPPGQKKSSSRPMYLLVRQVRINKRLDLAGIARRTDARIPAMISAELKRAERMEGRTRLRRGRR